MSARVRWYQKDIRITLGDGERFRVRSNGRTVLEATMTKTVDPTFLERMHGRGVGHDVRGGGPHRDIREVPSDAPGTWSITLKTLPYTAQEATYTIGNSGYFTDTKPTETERASDHGVDHDIRNGPRDFTR